MGTPVDIFATSPLRTTLVDAWLSLEKNVLALVKKPGRKLPDGKPMDADQVKALVSEVTVLMQKIGPLKPNLTTKLETGTTVLARKTVLAELEKRTAAATKQIVDFKKTGGSHFAIGALLFKAMDNLHTEVAAAHRTYAGYASGKIKFPTAPGAKPPAKIVTSGPGMTRDPR